MNLTPLKGLIPIVIAGSMTSENSAFAYNYNDASLNNTINLRNMDNKQMFVEENNYSGLILKHKFLEYLSKWESETIFLSSVNQIVDQKDFQGIVNLGKNVVPFIVDQLEQKPSCLVWALNYIYNKTISNQTITIEEASSRWIKEYKLGKLI